MKKLSYLFMLLTLCFSMGAMTSCSDDDDDGPNLGLSASQLFGIWQQNNATGDETTYYQFSKSLGSNNRYIGSIIVSDAEGSTTTTMSWMVLGNKLRVYTTSVSYYEYEVVLNGNTMGLSYTAPDGTRLSYSLTKINEL